MGCGRGSYAHSCEVGWMQTGGTTRERSGVTGCRRVLKGGGRIGGWRPMTTWKAGWSWTNNAARGRGCLLGEGRAGSERIGAEQEGDMAAVRSVGVWELR
jgi:hypothetical protein